MKASNAAADRKELEASRAETLELKAELAALREAHDATVRTNATLKAQVAGSQSAQRDAENSTSSLRDWARSWGALLGKKIEELDEMQTELEQKVAKK